MDFLVPLKLIRHKFQFTLSNQFQCAKQDFQSSSIPVQFLKIKSLILSFDFHFHFLPFTPFVSQFIFVNDLPSFLALKGSNFAPRLPQFSPMNFASFIFDYHLHRLHQQFLQHQNLQLQRHQPFLRSCLLKENIFANSFSFPQNTFVFQNHYQFENYPASVAIVTKIPFNLAFQKYA